MAKRLEPGEELYLLVSPKSRPLHQGYGPNVFYITYPWSNERRILRTLSEHLYSPLRLPLSRIDVLNTLIAPLVNTTVVDRHPHEDHARLHRARGTRPRCHALYRRMNYPRSARVADAIIINSESLRSEIEQYLEVDTRKLKLIYEAVDHDLFKPGDAGAARTRVASYGVTKPFVLFVSSLWPYKNCHGLLRAWALARSELGRPSAGCSSEADGTAEYIASLHSLAAELGICGRRRLCRRSPAARKPPCFYQAADVFVYPSLNETFGLPILEAMACGCPVVTSDTSAMPETAGGAAVLSDPKDPPPSPRPSSTRSGRAGTACGTPGSGEPASSPGALPLRPPSTFTARLTSVGGSREMKILVTGGAGFIGSHTCDRLLSLGHERGGARRTDPAGASGRRARQSKLRGRLLPGRHSQSRPAHQPPASGGRRLPFRRLSGLHARFLAGSPT